MKHRYIVVRNTYSDREFIRTSYGISLVENYDGVTAVLDSYPDLSQDMTNVERLVELCNELDLTPDHLQDVVDDCLASI